MLWRSWSLIFCFLSLFFMPTFSGDGFSAWAQDRSVSTPEEIHGSEAVEQRLTLGKSTMCERVENLRPVRPATVFSASVGQVSAFTAFDPVPEPTLIFHRWYHRDELSTQTRLRLYPPRWSTYSMIQLRETDKGPWRVEVTDENGQIIKVLRFSITD